MSDKVTIDGKTTWKYPRMSNLVLSLFATFGLAVFGGGIYGAITASGYYIAIYIAVAVFGLLFLCFALYNIGSIHVIFDDNSKTIYLEERHWCFQKSSNTEIGPYSGFKKCILHEELSSSGDGPRKMMYSLQFVYADGPKDLGEADTSNKESKEKFRTKCILPHLF